MGINSSEAIINLNKDTLKLTKNKIQEDYVNQDINARDRPKSGVLMLVDMYRVALTVTWMYNRGMDLNMDLLNKIK